MQRVKQKWDTIYSGLDAVTLRQHMYAPAAVLLQNAFLLPKQGKALDLACGLGANALFLAQKNFEVFAWDISTVAISQLRQRAEQLEITLNTCAANIDTALLAGCGFDIIVVQRFLARDLAPAICAALNPGGLLFYQTYTQAKTSDHGPKNPDFLLATGELLRLFPSLQLLYYRDNSLQGDWSLGLRNEAQFIGVKV